MSISELKEMDCSYCGKKGLRVRYKVLEKMVMDKNNELKNKIVWQVLCEYCSKMNEIIYEES